MFPVQDSKLLADALAERVLTRYALPGAAVCRFFGKGICDTYRIDTGGHEYYLNVYKHARRTKDDVSEEVRLLNHLADNGVLVARPVNRRDGRFLCQLVAPEGVRYSVLFEAATGDAGDNGDPRRIRALGEMVGCMHQCADRMSVFYRRSHLDMRHLVDDNLLVIASLLEHCGADFSLIRDIAEACKAWISQLLPESKPEYGICHGDLHGGDVFYDENSRPTLFDFDSSGCGWRALDIGVFFA